MPIYRRIDRDFAFRVLAYAHSRGAASQMRWARACTRGLGSASTPYITASLATRLREPLQINTLPFLHFPLPDRSSSIPPVRLLTPLIRKTMTGIKGLHPAPRGAAQRYYD
ncbi:hypothetical protein RSAG8_12797, partial [Rhizoctonia solani AG-8 WAC10335]